MSPVIGTTEGRFVSNWDRGTDERAVGGAARVPSAPRVRMITSMRVIDRMQLLATSLDP